MAPFEDPPRRMRTFFGNLVILKCTNPACPYFHFKDSFKVIDPDTGVRVINSDVVKKHASYTDLEERFVFLDPAHWEPCPRCSSDVILEPYLDDHPDGPIDILTWSALDWLTVRTPTGPVRLDDAYFGRD